MLLPKARAAKLTVRELADETLVYDLVAAKAHCLNRTAGLVWKHCDGQTTAAELAVMLQRELGIPSAEPLVHLALEQLGRRRLLETTPHEPASLRHSRRQLLRKLGVALAALPVIMTLAAPRAAQAASVVVCPPGQTFCFPASCVNLLTNVGNCGSCGNNCPGVVNRTCTAGTCGCANGGALCGGVCCGAGNRCNTDDQCVGT